MSEPNTLNSNLEKARQGICPYCGKGPFIIVATHVARIHGLDRFEFRNDIGAFLSDSLTDPDWHTDRSEWAKDRYQKDTAAGIVTIEPGHTKRVRTAVRHERQRNDSIRNAKTRQDTQRKTERVALVEAYRKGSTICEIAAVFKTNEKSVRARLKSEGVVLPDGRADPNRKRRIYTKGPVWYCTVEGCDLVGSRRRMCNKHYRRVIVEERNEAGPYCSADGCDLGAPVRGMCPKHLKRAYTADRLSKEKRTHER